MKGYVLLVVVLYSGWALADTPAGPFSTWAYTDPDSEEYGQAKGPKGTTCTCGTTFKSAGRIVGGKETAPNQYPHMVAIASVGGQGELSQFCGGTILTPYHVITAAHCTNGNNDPMAVVVGGHDLRTGNKYTKQYKVKEVKEHKDYNSDTTIHDIAILVVEGPIQFSEAVGPACLPTGPIAAGEYVKVTGWGDTSFNGEGSSVLLKVNLRVVPLDQCQALNGAVVLDNPTQMCTFAPQKDSCQGDSGGPVTWLDPETNRYVLVGLVSYGEGCATEKPGVNTDVWAYRDWIQKTISDTKPYQTCSKM